MKKQVIIHKFMLKKGLLNAYHLLILVIFFFFSSCGIVVLDVLPSLNVPYTTHQNYVYFKISRQYQIDNPSFQGVDIYYKIFPYSNMYYQKYSFSEVFSQERNNIMKVLRVSDVASTSKNVFLNGIHGTEGILLSYNYSPFHIRSSQGIYRNEKPYLRIDFNDFKSNVKSVLIKINANELLDPSQIGGGVLGERDLRLQYFFNTDDVLFDRSINNNFISGYYENFVRYNLNYYYNNYDNLVIGKFLNLYRDNNFQSTSNTIFELTDDKNYFIKTKNYSDLKYIKTLDPSASANFLDKPIANNQSFYIVFWVVIYGKRLINGENIVSYSFPENLGYILFPTK